MNPFQLFAVLAGTVALTFMATDLWNSFQDMMNEQRRERTRQHAPRNATPAQDGVPDALRCAVCTINLREIMIEPCNHVALCANCGYLVHRCPICNGRITNKRTVYIS